MGRHVSVASLHNRIRSGRQAAGLSQQELAKRCGLTRQQDAVTAADGLTVPTVQAVLAIAVRAPFQEELEALGGYDSSRTGTVVAEFPS